MRILALSAVIVMTFLVSPFVAIAGGPTSVIITSPTEGKAAARYTSDLDYIQLSQKLGDAPTTDPQALPLHGGPGSRALNVTWLIHDVQVWRVDRVFLSGYDEVWIETTMSFEGVKFDQRGIVHRPADQAGSAKLLNDILNTPETQAAAVRPATTAIAPQPAAQGIQWTSLLIGLGCGVMIALVGRVFYGLLSRRQV